MVGMVIVIVSCVLVVLAVVAGAAWWARRSFDTAGVAGVGGGRPDFTFDLPKGHVLYMDVKFPMASYLRHLEADTDEARAQHLRAFLKDVRDRVKELAKREYERGSTKPSVDYVLL